MSLYLCPYNYILISIPLQLYPYNYILITISLYPCPYIYALITISLYLYPYNYVLKSIPLQLYPYNYTLTTIPLQLYCDNYDNYALILYFQKKCVSGETLGGFPILSLSENLSELLNIGVQSPSEPKRIVAGLSHKPISETAKRFPS